MKLFVLYMFMCGCSLDEAFIELSRYWRPTNPNSNRPSLLRSFWKGYSSASDVNILPSVPALIRSDGYPLEIHHVTTSDGYILELHRIPHGRHTSSRQENQPVVLMGHCLYCASDTFVGAGKDKALAYLMADIGYDVWLLNARGTTYSTNHTRLSTKSKQFWDFSWHEIGIYDIPASIDYILDQTQVAQIDYIGFSMGTTIFFVLMSQRPEYNAKVRRMAALAPSVYDTLPRGPLARLSPYLPVVESVGSRINVLEFPPKSVDVNRILMNGCQPDYLFGRRICNAIFIALQGATPKNINRTRAVNIFLRFFPNTGSLQTLTHYLQRDISGEFQAFDHGTNTNVRTYGTAEPPDYNMSKVTVPVGLFLSEVDGFSSTKDVERLKSELANVAYVHKITDQNFDHFNFIWDDDIVNKLYLRVLKFIIYT